MLDAGDASCRLDPNLPDVGLELESDFADVGLELAALSDEPENEARPPLSCALLCVELSCALTRAHASSVNETSSAGFG